MKVCFIDDDADNRRQWLEWAERRGIEAKAFGTAYEANQYRADCYVFDVSAVTPMMVMHHAYGPVCRLMRDHPGAEIVIGSCMSRNAVEEVLDDVERASGLRPRFFDSSRGYDGLDVVMAAIGFTGSVVGVR